VRPVPDDAGVRQWECSCQRRIAEAQYTLRLDAYYRHPVIV
jgi:hypothetical protein